MSSQTRSTSPAERPARVGRSAAPRSVTGHVEDAFEDNVVDWCFSVEHADVAGGFKYDGSDLAEL